MERTYFRNNKVIKSPAHEGGNPQEGDYLRVAKANEPAFWYTNINGNWWFVRTEEIPAPIKTLILLGVA